jgi:hypothetical protein
MPHSNRKQFAFRLSALERNALVGVLDNAIARMKAMGRDPKLLVRIREKIAAPRDQGQEGHDV